eukprot:scaffold6966_cov112-Cylindrotheca_fusiformis.AAC.22
MEFGFRQGVRVMSRWLLGPGASMRTGTVAEVVNRCTVLDGANAVEKPQARIKQRTRNAGRKRSIVCGTSEEI